MSDNSVSANGGISVAGLLGVVFVTLKLCHVIAWPWLWVLAPFWIPVAIIGAFFILVLVMFVLGKAFGQ